MNEPLVSILLPTHARFRSGYLQRAIDSVLNQTYQNWELLVADDASTDGTAEYVQRLAAADPRIQHVRFDRNVGLPACTLAHAFLRSRGDYLAFIFDDSMFLPNHIATLLDGLLSEPGLGMVYGQTLMHFPSGTDLLGSPATVERLLERNCIGNPAVMLPRWVISEVGWYDPHIILKRSCDWDLWIRILQRFPALFIPEIVAEEFGSLLSDSLGRSHLLFLPLMEKYRAVSRDHLLAPDMIANGQYSVADVPFELTPEERLQIAVLVLQHYVRIAAIDRLVEYTNLLLEQAIPEFEHLMAKTGLPAELIRNDRSTLAFLGTAFYANYCVAELDAQRMNLEGMGTVPCDPTERIRQLNSAYWSLDERYHMLMRSKSWQLTRPLRELKRAVARFKDSQPLEQCCPDSGRNASAVIGRLKRGENPHHGVAENCDASPGRSSSID
ncbi:MAG TPA: glycosyltransferase family A protein [Candidatus Obscuribacterales bacterium]